MGCRSSRAAAANQPQRRAGEPEAAGNSSNTVLPGTATGPPGKAASKVGANGSDAHSTRKQGPASGSKARPQTSQTVQIAASSGKKANAVLVDHHCAAVKFWGAPLRPKKEQSKPETVDNIKEACARAADAAAGYVAARVLDGDWVSRHSDVGYYFKAPLALLEAGREADAERALNIAARYADLGGSGSSNEVYSFLYPQYPLLWLCWAASQMGSMDLARQCFGTIAKFLHPFTGSGLVGAPYESITNFEADFFATSIVAKAALLVGDGNAAREAADSLLRALDANRGNMQAGRFYLRWTWANGFCEEDDVLHCVQQKGSGQLFFMLGLPAAVLLEMGSSAYAQGSGRAYKVGGAELLEFLKGCNGVLTSSAAHQVAYAASLARDVETASRIAGNLISMQRTAGCFNDDPEALYVMDYTAEVSICLRQLCRDTAPMTDPTPLSSGLRPGGQIVAPVAATTLHAAEVKRPSSNAAAQANGRSQASAGAARGESGSEGKAIVESHALAVATFNQPTWCTECAGFLWGMRDQGLRCERCRLTVCKACSTSDGVKSRPCLSIGAQL